eukprot:31200-Pelagococcus_subviridis.AAC.9
MSGEKRREKSLRNGVHHANGVVWEPVYRTRLREKNLFHPFRRANVIRLVRDHDPQHDRVHRVQNRDVHERVEEHEHDRDGPDPLYRRHERRAHVGGDLRAVPYERTSGWS